DARSVEPRSAAVDPAVLRRAPRCRPRVPLVPDFTWSFSDRAAPGPFAGLRRRTGSVPVAALGEHRGHQIPQWAHQAPLSDLNGVLSVADLVDRPSRVRAVGRRQIQIGPAEQFAPAGGVGALLGLDPGTPDAAVAEDARYLDVHRPSLSLFLAVTPSRYDQKPRGLPAGWLSPPVNCPVPRRPNPP